MKKYVFGYGYTNKAITALFVIGAILRIGNQIMSFYWGCTEDDEDYKVLFTTETFFRIWRHPQRSMQLLLLLLLSVLAQRSHKNQHIERGAA